jgi:hypothetical protein
MEEEEEQKQQQQQQKRDVIDLTTPPRPPVVSRIGKEKEEADEDEDEDEQDSEEGHASKKDLQRVRNTVSHIKTTMERMFGVAISYPQNSTKMSDKGETIDWARGYGPTRLMEEIRFADGAAPKYGGFDMHKDNDNESARVKYVFKLPEAKDKVLCVPYYLMAEQVQKDAYFIRYLNERFLPLLDEVCMEVSILSRAILGREKTFSSLRKGDQIVNPTGRLILNIPPAMFPVTPLPPKLKNRNVDVEARKAEVRKQTERLAYLQGVATTADELVEKRERFREAEVERLKKSGSVTLAGPSSTGGGGGGGNNNNNAPAGGGTVFRPAENLPGNWDTLTAEEKCEELASRFYYVDSQLAVTNARCAGTRSQDCECNNRFSETRGGNSHGEIERQPI